MRWMPAIGWMLLIFIGSTDVFSAERTSRFLVPYLLWLDPHLSIAAVLTINIVLRKLAHVLSYTVLAALLWRALLGQAAFLLRIWAVALVALLAAATHAVLDELYQSFVPSRTASATDVAIDLGGALIGLAICWLFALRREPQIIY